MGRRGCYKHSFYGIESHRCMEATPSLACANKCVFCWRHHTNPVGKEWKARRRRPRALPTPPRPMRLHPMLCTLLLPYRGLKLRAPRDAP